MALVEYVIPYQIMETDKDKGTNRVVRNEITKVYPLLDVGIRGGN